MKPSERIGELMTLTGPVAREILRPVVQYLDEQAERGCAGGIAVKPSERLAELFKDAEGEVLEKLTRTQSLEVPDIFKLVTQPLQRLLDEQAELEQRRTHVRNALAMLGSYPGASRRVNEALETAGLKTRVSDGQPLSDCASCIVDEAKREGLF
jgi:hypothetical protein